MLPSAIEWARRNPEMFFGGGVPDAIQLVAWLIADVCQLSSGGCRVERDTGWWAVGSNADWLQTEGDVRSLFSRLVPAPEHGRNSMRAELLLGAFCRDISIHNRADNSVIAGSMAPTSLIHRINADQWCERIIAFRL
jgi:hypothetical protein